MQGNQHRAGDSPERRASHRPDLKLNKMVLERDVRALGADASSVFLLDESGMSLTGAPGTWDWIRSGFRVQLDLWPTVKRAISERKIVLITLEHAQELERDWFEPSGICRCVCAPLVAGGRALGVFFADTLQTERNAAQIDLSLVRRVAMRWAEALLVAERARTEPSPELSGVRLRPAFRQEPEATATFELRYGGNKR